MNIVKMSEEALKRGTWTSSDHHNLLVYINKCSVVLRLAGENEKMMEGVCDVRNRMENAIESFENKEDYI